MPLPGMFSRSPVECVLLVLYLNPAGYIMTLSVNVKSNILSTLRTLTPRLFKDFSNDYCLWSDTKKNLTNQINIYSSDSQSVFSHISRLSFSNTANILPKLCFHITSLSVFFISKSRKLLWLTLWVLCVVEGRKHSYKMPLSVLLSLKRMEKTIPSAIQYLLGKKNLLVITAI